LSVKPVARAVSLPAAQKPAPLFPLDHLLACHFALLALAAVCVSAPLASEVAAVCVLGFALAKTLAYGLLLERIGFRVSEREITFPAFLRALVGLSFTAMFSFALDFFVLYRMDAASLAGMNARWGTAETFFNCWYFSALNFSFFGVADIVPITTSAKALLTVEALTSFFTMGFILADFVALREALRRTAPTRT
jgi:hypothetical protein